MYFANNVTTADTIYTLQGLQVVAAVAALAIIGYVLFQKNNFNRTIKLCLWCLAAVWVIVSVGLYAYASRNYFHYTRPAYQESNRQSGQNY